MDIDLQKEAKQKISLHVTVFAFMIKFLGLGIIVISKVVTLKMSIIQINFSECKQHQNITV